jgi:hypothetical protein
VTVAEYASALLLWPLALLELTPRAAAHVLTVTCRAITPASNSQRNPRP